MQELLTERDRLNLVEQISNKASFFFEDLMVAYCSPAFTHKLIPYMDGNKWCVLLGPNIQEGICGFGDSPKAACDDFDAVWIWGWSKNQPAPTPGQKGESDVAKDR